MQDVAQDVTFQRTASVLVGVHIQSQLCPALAGNRTWASRVAGENSTTEQPMLTLLVTLAHKIGLKQIYICRTNSPCSRQEMLERHSS